jgi:hypothetical protein
MTHRSELLPQPKQLPIKNSSGLSDKSKELSKSSVSSKCLTTEETLQGQIVQLKEKAHQSFMQVMYATPHPAKCSNSTRRNSNSSAVSSQTKNDNSNSESRSTNRGSVSCR